MREREKLSIDGFLELLFSGRFDELFVSADMDKFTKFLRENTQGRPKFAISFPTTSGPAYCIYPIDFSGENELKLQSGGEVRLYFPKDKKMPDPKEISGIPVFSLSQTVFWKDFAKKDN